MKEDELVIPVKTCEDCVHAKRKALKEKNHELNSTLVKLYRKIDELNSQIEKMKCCTNCLFYDGCSSCIVQGCVNNSKWEFAE